MKKKLDHPTLSNLLRLFSHRLQEFSGESRRSYQKAYSSFQLFVVGKYQMDTTFDISVVENWVVYNLLQGLSRKTVSFYLEKISSLYSGVAHKLIGGKKESFKIIKRKLKDLPYVNYSKPIDKIGDKIQAMAHKAITSNKNYRILDFLKSSSCSKIAENKESLKIIWGVMALKAGIYPNIVRTYVGKLPSLLDVLQICSKLEMTEEDGSQADKILNDSLKGEDPQWFAMRLRPRIKYEKLIDRFTQLSGEINMPELFYPCEEIRKLIGRKIIWKGKPVIRDVVFFKTHRYEIFPLFTKLYDLAWCYRTPGGGPGNYASIPLKAMEDFKNALGFLSPDYDVVPSGETDLKPGEKVVIVDGEYARKAAQILKKASFDEDGNKVYRVTLLNCNGHWDIGIDARLLKKA